MTIIDSIFAAFLPPTAEDNAPVSPAAPERERTEIDKLRSDLADVNIAHRRAQDTASKCAATAAEIEREADAAEAALAKCIEERASDAELLRADDAARVARMRLPPVAKWAAEAAGILASLTASKSEMEAAIAKIEAEAEERTARAALEVAASLDAFKARQAARAVRMLALAAELRTLAVESDQDFFSTDDAGRALGLPALDTGPLVFDLVPPIVNADEAKRVRNVVAVDRDFRRALTKNVTKFFDDLAKVAYPSADACYFDFAELRRHRNMAQYTTAAGERRQAAEDARIAEIETEHVATLLAKQAADASPAEREELMPLRGATSSPLFGDEGWDAR